jgi:hypothetical protein
MSRGHAFHEQPKAELQMQWLKSSRNLANLEQECSLVQQIPRVQFKEIHKYSFCARIHRYIHLQRTCSTAAC